MSYILDALKRADAERGQTAGVASTDTQPHALGRRPPVPWWRSGTGVLALGAALVGVAALTALWWPSAEVAIPVASAPEPAPQPVPTPAPPPAPEPPPAVAADALGRPAPILMPERPVVARPAEAASSAAFGPDPVPTMPAAVTRQPEPSPRPPQQPPSPPARQAAAPSVPVASAAPASAPPVKVTGSTYSDNPAHRMLIVNGKIVLEGQQIEPGLTLEVITPHSAVLNHQGSRYNINY